LAIIYSIALIFTIPTVFQDIGIADIFSLLLAVIILIVAVIPNIILTIFGGAIAIVLKNSPKDKGITSEEISKKLQEKRKKE